MLGGGNIVMSNNEFIKKFSLDGKVAIITGASGDIGCALAKALFDAGASIVIAATNEQKLFKAAEKIGAPKEKMLICPMDVTKIEQIETLMSKTMEKFNKIDILVNAAGIQVRKPAMEFSQKEWNEVLNVNLSGSFFCSQVASKYMAEQKKGKVIMISSLTAEIGLPNMAAYVASKGAIKQLTKALATEWAKYGITVNCIGPGRYQTSMTADIFNNDEINNTFMKLIPLGRSGVPSDLAGIIVLLASDLSDYITGQSFYIDGGWLAAGGNPKG